VLVATVAALAGDLVTFAVARVGGPVAVRRISRGQTPAQLAKVQDRFTRQGWQLVVVGRLVPAGRIPVLVAAGTLGYPWRRFVPAGLVACLLWAVAYAVLGVVSGGLFDNPLVASLAAAVLVLVVAGLSTWISSLVRKRRHPEEPPEPVDERISPDPTGPTDPAEPEEHAP
jgi:membrane protein DedA with SNARE-associated domain